MARRRRRPPAKPKTVALSDDEQSDFEQPGIPIRGSNSNLDEDEFASDDEPSTNGNALNDDGAGAVGDEEDEEAEDLEEDEFIVEAIKKHMIDDDGSLKFLVKWEGWEKKADMTWEPEDNLLESAAEILEDYFTSIGGRDNIFEETEKAARGKKRGRASTGTTTATKRSRKNGAGAHPAASTPPASAKKWSPPAGSWEDEIESIDACEDEGNGRLIVYLIWKNGNKTKHETSVIYKKCPQKMLQFYERHVKIIKDENRAATD
ncbi:chromo domain-containing protein [Purpureocillium lavendulum]|uniref:Chromo domain-containing protein n=1 Tax=Purpureocillium lavendulum TaxID=1247861 RepID=A0AB34FRX8_9HYPO|nr:chromo domain-containing protein [Purpureocillium lavendulum]